MSKNTITARVRARIEEELGGFRAFADLPSTEIEAIAERLTRALEPYLAAAPAAEEATQAAA